MHFSKIAISTAFIAAAFASAAPIASPKAAATPAEARGVDEDVSAEKRLNPAVFLGGAGLLTSFLGSKEGQEFAASKEGQEFLSKMASVQARDFDEESAEKRLNPAFMIGNVAGSILPEIFGSKEAADEFLAKLQASQNSNSTSGIEARGSKTDVSGLVAAGLNLLHTLGARDVEEESAEKRLNPAFMIGSVGGSVLSSIFGSKEAADAYLAQIKSSQSQSQSQPSARDVEASPEKRLSWAKAGAGAAGALLGWLQSKEGQDWAASKEGQEFLSKAAATPIQARDVAEMEERAGKIGTAAGWGTGINIANAILGILKPDGQQKRDFEMNGDLDLLGLIHPSIKVDA